MELMVPTLVLPIFELRFRKEALTKVRGKLVRDDDRFAALPETPAQFATLKGGYKTVSERACAMNEAQMRSGFMDYLFFPEVETAPVGDSASQLNGS